MSKLCAAAAAFLASTMLQAPAQAAPAHPASEMTQAFLANVAANLTILDTSSRLARNHSDSAALQAYATSETTETKQVAVALTGATPPAIRAALLETEGAVTTGRSVAVAGSPARGEAEPDPSMLEAANGRMPPTDNLATLKTLQGAAFDKLFFTLQLDALSQIESDYRAYIDNGDDLAIAAMAHAQLPGLLKRLEALSGV